MGTDRIEIAVTEITATPTRVDVGPISNGLGLIRFYMGDHVANIHATADQLRQLRASLDKLIVLLESRVAKKQ